MKSFKHGGNLKQLMSLSGLSADEILDFSANINPMGLPEWFRPVFSSTLASVVHYPDPECADLVKTAAERHTCPPDQVLVGNGSSDVLPLLQRGQFPVPSGQHEFVSMSAEDAAKFLKQNYNSSH